MGDRVSISFRNGANESVPLFSHWGGMMLVARAREFAAGLHHSKGENDITPLNPLDPGAVMVAFVRQLSHDLEPTEFDNVLGSLRVGDIQDPMLGRNEDNGHHVIDLQGDEG